MVGVRGLAEFLSVWRLRIRVEATPVLQGTVTLPGVGPHLLRAQSAVSLSGLVC